MIDLHSHVLPGIDDGAADGQASVALARLAASTGTRTLAATPHVNRRYGVRPEEIAGRVESLRTLLAGSDVPLELVAGGELSVSRLDGLDDEQLASLCLGGGDCLLVESPYEQAAPFFEERLFDLQLRGFRPLLAHPERCPAFQARPERLEALVRQGVLCSVTAGSMAGRFGSVVRRFCARLFEAGLVHDVSSDAHDVDRRPPGLAVGFEALDVELPGLAGQSGWYCLDAPAAILAGERLPPRPPPPRRRRAWRRLVERASPSRR